MPHIEAFMRLALKAQAQCRATLEAARADLGGPSATRTPPLIIRFAKRSVRNRTGG